MTTEIPRTFVAGIATFVWVTISVLLLVGIEGDYTYVTTSILVLFTYSSFMMWRTVFGSQVSPVQLMFWLFNSNFLLLPALSQSINRSFYWSPYDNYDPSVLLFTCSIILIGFVAFALGTRVANKRIGATADHPPSNFFLTQPLEETRRSKLFITVTLLGLIGMIIFYGLDIFIASRGSVSDLVGADANIGLLVYLPRALATGSLLFLVAILTYRWRQTRKISVSVLFLLLIALGVNAIINYPLSLPRYWIFGFLISLIWIVTPLRLAKWRAAFVVSFTFLQFTLLPFYSQITRDKGLVAFDLPSIRQYLLHGDFDGFQQVVNAISYIQFSGFELGRNMGSIVLFFIPRAIWEDKAEPLGWAAAEFMQYSYVNLSSPIYAELFADLGIVSLVLGMAFIGYNMRRLDTSYARLLVVSQFGPGILLTSVFAGYTIIVLRGSLLGILPAIAVLMSFLFAVSYLARSPRQSSLSPESPSSNKNA